MYSAQFIFKPGTYDDEFYRLDGAIEEFVNTLPGFLGVEKWSNAEGDVKNHIYYFADKETLTTFSRFPDHLTAKGGVKNSIYYFADKETLKEFSRFPDHLTAKAGVQRWYDGYEVVISEAVAAYGDGKIPSIASGVKGKGTFYAG